MKRAEALVVVKAVQDHCERRGYEVPETAWFLADHTHEGMAEGNWSLACEGYLPDEWTYEVWGDTKVYSDLVFAGLDVLLEPRSGCVLGIIDESS